MDWARAIRALVDFIMQIVAFFKKSENPADNSAGFKLFN